MRPVKIHAAGETGIFLMLPLLLYASQLIAFQIEQYSAYAAGAGVDRQQISRIHSMNLPYIYSYSVLIPP